MKIFHKFDLSYFSSLKSNRLEIKQANLTKSEQIKGCLAPLKSSTG